MEDLGGLCGQWFKVETLENILKTNEFLRKYLHNIPFVGAEANVIHIHLSISYSYGRLDLLKGILRGFWYRNEGHHLGEYVQVLSRSSTDDEIDEYFLHRGNDDETHRDRGAH